MSASLSNLTDDQLKALYGASQAAPSPPASLSAAQAAENPGLSSMSDDAIKTAYAATQGHQIAGPSDSFISDVPRRLGSAAIDAITGIMSPITRASPGAVGLSFEGGTPHIVRPTANPTDADSQNALRQARDTLYNTAGVTEYQPSTEGGRLGQAALTGAAGGLLTGGGALASGAGGALGQALIEHTPLPPLAAALVGQLAGAKGTQTALSQTSHMMPGAIAPETLALARTASDMGITVPMAKASNNPFVRYLDSAVRRMPFSGYSAMDEANQAAVNRNAAASFGETATKITPEVLNSAYNRLGPVFENIGGRYNVPLTPDLQNALANVHQQAGEVGLDAGQAAAVRAHIDKIWDIAANNGGVIPGDVYVNLTKRGESLDRLQGNRSTTAGQLGGDIRDALDNALMSAASPEDAAALQQARTQYKALKTVEPLTMRADTAGGATPTTGDISGPALLARVSQQYKNAPRAELGDIPLKDLAQVSQRFLKEPSSSGTAERSGIAKLGETIVAPLGAMLGHEYGIPLHYTLPPLAAAILGPPIVGSFLRSPGFVNRQINGPQFSPLAQTLTAQPLIAREAGQ